MLNTVGGLGGQAGGSCQNLKEARGFILKDTVWKISQLDLSIIQLKSVFLLYQLKYIIRAMMAFSLYYFKIFLHST